MDDAVIMPSNIGKLCFDFNDVCSLERGSAHNGHIAHTPIFSYHIAPAKHSMLVDAGACNADAPLEVGLLSIFNQLDLKYVNNPENCQVVEFAEGILQRETAILLRSSDVRRRINTFDRCITIVPGVDRNSPIVGLATA